MNIFAFDFNPAAAAKDHCDKHCVKMILEYAQLLSTAHRVLDGNIKIVKSASGRSVKRYVLDDKKMNDALYSATHVNHPSAIWARQSHGNYEWLYDLFVECSMQYMKRYGNIHQSYLKLAVLLRDYPTNITAREVSFPDSMLAMPDDCKIPGDVFASYRSYFNKTKQRMAVWKHGEVPNWFVPSAA